MSQPPPSVRMDAHEQATGVALAPKPRTLGLTRTPLPIRVVKCQSPVLTRYRAGSSTCADKAGDGVSAQTGALWVVDY